MFSPVVQKAAPAPTPVVRIDMPRLRGQVNVVFGAQKRGFPRAEAGSPGVKSPFECSGESCMLSGDRGQGQETQLSCVRYQICGWSAGGALERPGEQEVA